MSPIVSVEELARLDELGTDLPVATLHGEELRAERFVDADAYLRNSLRFIVWLDQAPETANQGLGVKPSNRAASLSRSSRVKNSPDAGDPE